MEPLKGAGHCSKYRRQRGDTRARNPKALSKLCRFRPKTGKKA